VTDLKGDEELRRRFLELREDVERSGAAPDFQVMWARTEALAAEPTAHESASRGSDERTLVWRRRRVLRVGAWATAALAAVLTGLILVRHGPDDEARFESLVAAYDNDAWRSPTAGLLDVPGIELMRAAPSVGGATGGLENPSARPDARSPGPREDL
jgi:hypothetical protein